MRVAVLGIGTKLPVGSNRKRRLEIAVVLCTLLLSALFLAQGASGLLAAALLELEPVDAAVGLSAMRSARPTTRVRDPMAILRRNIFDSQTGPLDGSAVQPVEATPVDEPIDPNAPPPPCEGSVRLVAALVNIRRPENSLAAITGATGTAEVYRPGMEVDSRHLIAIETDRVLMRPGGGQVCQLTMFAGGEQIANGAMASVTPATVSVTPPDEPAESPGDVRPGGITPAELDQYITRVSDTQYTIARRLVDRVRENQAEVIRMARIIPQEVGGRVVGVKLYGIRRNSVLGRLGMQNGDMLRTINGYDMTSPESGLEAYARLQSADHLTVAVERRGQPVTLDFNIQ